MTANTLSPFTELWEFASPLDHAWFHFASAEMKEQYRTAQDQQQMLALQALMEGEVQQFLANGDLCAIGIALPFAAGSAPEEISPLLFSALSTAVDWAKSTISGLGCTFDEVRVIHASKLASVLSAVPSKEIQAPLPVEPRRKGGRTNTYPYSAQVLHLLHKTEANRHLSAEKLHPAFKAEFERQFPMTEFQIPAPSVRKLRDQLKQFRQELEETGSN